MSGPLYAYGLSSKRAILSHPVVANVHTLRICRCTVPRFSTTVHIFIIQRISIVCPASWCRSVLAVGVAFSWLLLLLVWCGVAFVAFNHLICRCSWSVAAFIPLFYCFLFQLVWYRRRKNSLCLLLRGVALRKIAVFSRFSIISCVHVFLILHLWIFFSAQPLLCPVGPECVCLVSKWASLTA